MLNFFLINCITDKIIQILNYIVSFFHHLWLWSHIVNRSFNISFKYINIYETINKAIILNLIYTQIIKFPQGPHLGPALFFCCGSFFERSIYITKYVSITLMSSLSFRSTVFINLWTTTAITLGKGLIILQCTCTIFTNK